MKEFLKKTGFSLCVIAAALLWTTCNVGLGESVDNDAPTLTVTGPTKASVCSDKVTITGTCSDDKGVKSVNIVLKNTNTGASYSYNGIIDKSSKSANGAYNWERIVNEKDSVTGKYPLPDGKYVVDVTVTDVNNRTSGVSSTAFDIDNTAPFFCVTSPTSLAISGSKVYGRSVTISGEIADDHAIEQMEIKVYKINGSSETPVTLVKSVFTGFETAGGTTVYIAKYFDTAPTDTNSDDYELYQNYLAIYDGAVTDANKNSDMYIKIVPTLTDFAGNESDHCYVASPLKSLLANKYFGGNLTKDSLQTAQLQRVYNGTYILGEFTKEQQEEVVKILNGYDNAVDTYYCGTVPADAEDEAGKEFNFAATVNSNNSPTYDFAGYENPTANWVGVNTGGTITITLKAGRDGWGILPDSLKVNLYNYDSSKTDKKGALAYSSEETDPKKKIYIKDATNKETKDIKTSVTNQSYYVTLPSLRGGNHYILEAKGRDENCNDENASNLEPAKSLYGFKVATSVTPPKLSAKDPYYVNGSQAASDKFTINIKDESDGIKDSDKGVVVKSTLYQGHIPSIGNIETHTGAKLVDKEDVYTGNSIALDDGSETTYYHLDLPITSFDDASSKMTEADNYTIVIKAYGKYKDVDGTSIVPANDNDASMSTFIFWVDKKPPVLAMTSPKYENKSTDVILITEDFDSFESKNGGYYITPTGNWSDLGGSGTHSLWYTVRDDGTPTVTYNAATGESTLTGSATDKVWNLIENISQVATKTDWEQEIQVEQGNNKIFRVVGVDAVGNLSEIVGRTDYKYDFDVPKITVTEPNVVHTVGANKYYNLESVADGKVTIKFVVEASHEISPADVVVSAKKNGSETTSGFTLTKTPTSAAKIVTATVELPAATATTSSDGEWTFTVSATDTAGRPATSTTTLTRILDTVAPVFNTIDYESGWISSTSIAFSGTLKEMTSGLDKIAYTTKPTGSGTDATKHFTGKEVFDAASNKGAAVAYSIKALNLAQSQRTASGIESNTVMLDVYDTAGNKLTRSFTVNVDLDAPSALGAYYTYADTAAAAFSAADLFAAKGKLVWNGSKDMTVYGTVSSPLSGLDSLTWKIGDDAVTPKTLLFTTAANLNQGETDDAKKQSFINVTDWKTLEAIGADSAHRITGWKAVLTPTADSTIDPPVTVSLKAGDVKITATNKAKLSAETTIFSVEKDVTAPVITLKSPDPAKAVSGTKKISGTASDTNLLSVKIYASSNNVTTSVSGDTELENEGSIYNWRVNNVFSRVEGNNFKFGQTGGAAYDGNTNPRYIKVIATDKADNEKRESFTYTVDPGMDRPIIKFSAPADLSGMLPASPVAKTGNESLTGKVYNSDNTTSGLELYYNDCGEKDANNKPFWRSLELASGNFELKNYKNDEPDGEHKILFKVVKDGVEYIASAGGDDDASWLRPKIYKSGSADDGDETFFGGGVNGDRDDTTVYVVIDTKDPRIRYPKYQINNEEKKSATGTVELGGVKNKLKLYFDVFDENGVDEEKMTFEFAGKTYLKTARSGETNDVGGCLELGPAATDGWQTVVVGGTDGIDVSGFVSDTFTGKFTAYDKYGGTAECRVMIKVDNEAPVISLIAPSKDESVSGIVKAYGTVDGVSNDVDGVSKMEYALTYTDDNNDGTVEPADSAYQKLNIKTGSLRWNLYFDGDTSATDGETHLPKLNNFIIEKGVTIGGKPATDDSVYKDKDFTENVHIYLWLKAQDKFENKVAAQSFEIVLDPQGNLPTVTISYPAGDSEVISRKNTKFYGGAKAKAKNADGNLLSIQKVYALLYKLDAAGTETKLTKAQLTAAYPDATIEKIPGSSDDWAVVCALNGSSWSVLVNKGGELGEKAGIRVYSYDGANLSVAAQRTFVIDEGAPQLSNEYLRQYAAATSALVSSKTYDEGLYVKGTNWYLTFDLSDNEKLEEIKIGETTYLKWNKDSSAYSTDEVKAAGTAGAVVTGAKDAESGVYKEVSVKYPLGIEASGVGTKKITVSFKDSTTTVYQTYVISYDNTAPVLAKTTDSQYSINEEVRQNNGWYSLQSKVTEVNASDGTEQSGFASLAFYFKRGDYVFDPMIKRGNAANKIRVEGTGDDSRDDIVKEDGLYWIKQTVTRSSGDDAESLATITIAADPNIHVGGLAKIGGTVYRIDSINTSGTQAKLSGAPEKSWTEALFAIANVVDHDNQESETGTRGEGDDSGYGFGYDSAGPNYDDGDLMIEGVENIDKDWNWSASIYSRNIPDGPIEIHYTAYDKAGNWSCAGGAAQSTDANASNPPVVSANVCNNRPRIANIYVGTDLNGDNVVGNDGDEYETKKGEWAAPYKTTALVWSQDYNTDKDTDTNLAVTSATLGSGDDGTSAYLTAKGKTIVRPEILGGNGEIRYAYNISKRDGTTADGKTKYTTIIEGHNDTAFITGDSASSIGTGKGVSDTTKRQGDITIQVGDFASIPDCGSSDAHKFEFTFYDETDGAAAYGAEGYASRKDLAKATVYMAVSMKDNEQPKITREKLFWNAAGAEDDEGEPNNSVAWNGSKPLGHIDLSEDLKDVKDAENNVIWASPFTAASGEMDKDDKVSGKIVLRGNISDNKMLYKVYLKIPSMATQFGNAGMAPNATYGYVAATYNASSGAWVTTDKLAVNGIKFEISNDKITSSKHSAKWTFTWDTSYITNVAATDVTVDVYASDQLLESAVDNTNGTLIGLDGTTKYKVPAPKENKFSADAANHPAQLKVDVVPYITGLTTYLSGKGVEYARTALGHWPVWYRTDSKTTAGSYTTSKETFSVQGFNFSQGNGDKTGQSLTKSDLDFEVDVNGVKSLNNLNYNGAKLSGTSYSNAYNRQPNGKNNNLLTDDVCIDVWQLNGKAAVPSALKIETPTMKINPEKALIGFAFRYGTANKHFAMPNGSTNSYTWWYSANDIQNSATFNYDNGGYSYGTVAGGESGGTYSDRFSIYSSWWGTASNVNNTDNRTCIETTGQKGAKTMSPASYSADYTGTYANTATGSTVSPNEKTKHQSPSVATAGTNVYLAYFDAFNQEIRFRSSLGTAFSATHGNVGNFVSENQDANNASVVTYSYANCQIVAQANTMAQGGEYVSIAALPDAGDKIDETKYDDAVVMVWYDATNNKMWYSYNNKPSTDRSGKINTQRAADVATNGWSVPVAIFADKGKSVSGEYCKVAFDGNGGVHIAAFDSAAGDVWYAYLASHAAPGDAVVCRVDADGTVGENLTLDVALNKSGAALPCIGYYNTSRSLPKYARPATAGVYQDGAVGGKFTGKWEVTCIPTTNSAPQGTINVGLWKTKVAAKNASGSITNGVIKYSTTDGNKPDASNVGKSVYTTNNSGSCYGNGTANAVLGYAIGDASDSSRGYLETAQLTGNYTY